VAILKGGKVARSGSLDELRAHETNSIEIIATSAGADHTLLERLLAGVATISSEPRGLRIEVTDEKNVDLVLAKLRETNGKLISVNPVKQSLEDLFLD
jgi:ABC-type multidrug transport system ATPase subunit